ncbi:MAG: hypothetical protein IH598_17340 [Bacteroidales bacterium]|nr:hypothetical protein [Bacteroidales bacterium]
MKLLAFFILLCGCTQSNSLKTQSNEEPQITLDSLMQYVKKEFEVIRLEHNGDTLLIVSTNDVLFYPFGEYANFKDFKDGYLDKRDLKVKIDSSFNFFRIFSMNNNKTSVKLLENFETEKLELFKSDIKDNSFELFYEIRIGMKKEEVFLKFFTKTFPGINHIRTIRINSGLAGVCYYFNFSTKEQLENIIIESDYVLD